MSAIVGKMQVSVYDAIFFINLKILNYTKHLKNEANSETVLEFEPDVTYAHREDSDFLDRGIFQIMFHIQSDFSS